MFNSDFKKEEIAKLESAHKKYEARAEKVAKQSIELMELRHNSSKTLITEVEQYINSLANSPKMLDKSCAEYKAEFLSFRHIIDDLREEAVDSSIKSGISAGAGVAAGVGVAAFAPTAAMGVATTFGVASTGTAISALSGAAATNAALAWLGGGALAAGGAGMAAGQTLLALAGPVGWAIGGISLLGTGVFSARKNKQIGEEAMAKRKEIKTLDKSLKAALVEIKELLGLTKTHVNGTKELLDQLKAMPVQDYSQFNVEQKQKLGALVNHINSLSALLNKKVDA